MATPRPRSIRTAAFLVLALAGCGGGNATSTGGGGGGGSSTSSSASASGGSSSAGGGSVGEVTIAFPPKRSLTNEKKVHVRGSTSEPARVASLTVGGVTATTQDGFATWTADVPLETGLHTLHVDAVDAQGAAHPGVASVQVDREVFLISAASMAVDESAGRAFVSAKDDGGHQEMLVQVDLGTGARRVVSGDGIGAGPELGVPAFAGLVWYAASGRVIGIEPESALWSIDPASGARTKIADYASAGPRAVGLVLDEAGGRLVTADYASGAVLALDPVTGASTTISDATHGSGPARAFPQAIAFDAASSRLFVGLQSHQDIYAVSLSSGDRVLLSGGGVGAGPALESLYGMTFDPAGARLVVADDVAGHFVAVDAATGDRTTLPGPPASANEAPGLAVGSLVMHAGSILAVDDTVDAIASFDLSTGARADVSRIGVGSGPPVETTDTGAAYDASSDAFYFFDVQHAALASVDRETGARRIVSDATHGSGPSLGAVYDLVAVHGFGYAACVAGDAPLQRIDFTTGDRVALPTGSGPSLGAPVALTRDAAADRLYLLNNAGQVLSLDPHTGDAALVSDEGSGPSLVFHRGLWFAGDALFAGDSVDLVRIDVASGARTVISDAMTGAGPTLLGDHGAVGADGKTLFLATGAGLLTVDLTSGDRSAVSTGAPPLEGLALDADGQPWATTEYFGALATFDLASGARVYASK
ncbi:MAG TPA: hypothetical protein VHB21_13720 [Minicystis sp.]|nr:hypothetical protein [Minicystis sp.]